MILVGTFQPSGFEEFIVINFMVEEFKIIMFMVEEIMVEKFMVEEFMVEKSGVEMSCNLYFHLILKLHIYE